MLNLFRWHTRSCPHEGRDYTKCQCPIWCDWTSGNTRLRKSLGLRDWQAAQRRARDMEIAGIEAYVAGNHQGAGALTVKKASDDLSA